MAILNPEKVAARQRKRHPKAFQDMDELLAFRMFQHAEMDRLQIPTSRRRLRTPAIETERKPR
jgi:hypothetical protein